MSDRMQWIEPGLPIFEMWTIPVGDVIVSHFGVEAAQGIYAHPFDVAAMLHPRDPIARLDVVLAKILERVNSQCIAAQRRVDRACDRTEVASKHDA